MSYCGRRCRAVCRVSLLARYAGFAVLGGGGGGSYAEVWGHVRSLGGYRGHAVPPAAVAQDVDQSAFTSLDPLLQILESFSASESIDELTVPSGAGSEAAMVSQFQILVNLGSAPAFGVEDTELIPTGLSSGSDAALVSLEEQFDGTLGPFSRVPPLAPFLAGEDGMDISELAQGWAAYDEAGPINGAVTILEDLQVVWGMELAQPFDTTCADATYVGRSWVGSTVSGPDPSFTTDALNGIFGGATHEALADGRSRIVQLTCSVGSTPIVAARRMTDTGVRVFGPVGAVALVKDNFVVFFNPVRILGPDLTQSFFATPPGGGPVATSDIDGEHRVLLPNPYGPRNRM